MFCPHKFSSLVLFLNKKQKWGLLQRLGFGIASVLLLLLTITFSIGDLKESYRLDKLMLEAVNDNRLLFVHHGTIDVFTNASDATKLPNLEIFLPVAPTKRGLREYATLFLPTFSLFWPLAEAKTPLVVVADKGTSHGDRNLLRRLLKATLKNSRQLTPLPFRIALNSMPPSFVSAKMPGHNRQEWLMLWADNFTRAEYVGFIDTDAVFVTRVTLNDLFDDNGRPIVRPLYGQPTHAGGGYWKLVPKSTYKAIGRKAPFTCMTYFPVVVKVSHLALLREHICRQLNVTNFDAAFLDITRNPYAQFDLICAYLWYFHRDEYHWMISQRNPEWTGPVPEGQVENIVEAGGSPEYLTNTNHLRLAIHWNYLLIPFDISIVVATGICYALPENDNRRPSNKCAILLQGHNRTDFINVYEWTFEYAVFLHDLTTALAVHRRRLDLIDKIPMDWQRDEIFDYLDNSVNWENIDNIHRWTRVDALLAMVNSIYRSQNNNPESALLGFHQN